MAKEIQPGPLRQSEADALTDGLAQIERTRQDVERMVPDIDEFIPAKLTSYSAGTGTYAWTLQAFDASGVRYDHPNGRTGTTTHDPAQDPNGTVLTTFPAQVWLKKTLTVSDGTGTVFEIFYVGDGTNYSLTVGNLNASLSGSNHVDYTAITHIDFASSTADGANGGFNAWHITTNPDDSAHIFAFIRDAELATPGIVNCFEGQNLGRGLKHVRSIGFGVFGNPYSGGQAYYAIGPIAQGSQYSHGLAAFRGYGYADEDYGLVEFATNLLTLGESKNGILDAGGKQSHGRQQAYVDVVAPGPSASYFLQIRGNDYRIINGVEMQFGFNYFGAGPIASVFQLTYSGRGIYSTGNPNITETSIQGVKSKYVVAETSQSINPGIPTPNTGAPPGGFAIISANGGYGGPRFWEGLSGSITVPNPVASGSLIYDFLGGILVDVREGGGSSKLTVAGGGTGNDTYNPGSLLSYFPATNSTEEYIGSVASTRTNFSTGRVQFRLGEDTWMEMSSESF